MAKNRPDFTQIFFDSLGGEPAPVVFEIRHDANLVHDLIFVSSLVHDARVLNCGEATIGGRLVVQLDRDCWELDPKESPAIEYPICRSTLTIAGIRSAKWKLENSALQPPWLSSLWIDDAYRHAKSFLFVLRGDGWDGRIRLKQDDWSITLQDEEAPYLYSARHPKS